MTTSMTAVELIDLQRRKDAVAVKREWARIIGRHEFDVMTTITFAVPKRTSEACFQEAIRLGKRYGVKRAAWAAESFADKKSGKHLHGLVAFRNEGNRALFEAEARKLGICKHEPVWGSTGAAAYITKHFADGDGDIYLFPGRMEMWEGSEDGDGVEDVA